RLMAAGLVATLTLVAGPAAHAGPPTDQLKTAIDRILVILQDPSLKQPGKAEERRQKIRSVANEVFDWEEMGKRALARHWEARSPQEREEFSKLFADLLERSYVGKIEGYSGEKIVYEKETPDGDRAEVRTKLMTKSGTSIPIDYQMQKSGDRWRAYDVKIENVGLVANYRAQFNRIIQQSGYADLVGRLKAKAEELQFDEGAGKGKKP
ncbi:MAG: MlaC/ttg2D family ABC transporter substrate-binding protein, partial [Candidatus Rokuibacteriota bacterium]